jgi:hypothetical protein
MTIRTGIGWTASLGSLVAFLALAAPVGAQTQQERPVTFTKDVAPIVERSCQTCHRKGQMAPMSLMTYEEVRPYARAIKQKLITGEMPPWGVDAHVGIQRFKNDSSLTQDEVAMMVKWVDAGAPRGDAKDMRPARVFNDAAAWSLPGEPDLVVAGESHTTKANAHEEWAELFADIPLEEDRWVRAYQSLPSKAGVQVVHHMVAYIIRPDGATDGYGLHYVPGKPATIYQEDAGFLLRAGSRIKFDMHYTSIGTAVTDQPRVALMFYPKGYEPKNKVVRLNWASLGDLDIPVGEANARSDGYALIRSNLRLMTYVPHMHIRGSKQCIELIFPESGQTEMLNCFGFNFLWQQVFHYEDDAQPLIPKSTILHVINYHDNSRSNEYNPDPKNWTGFGQRSVDDMAIAMGEGMRLSDEEFERMVEERQEKLAASRKF